MFTQAPSLAPWRPRVRSSLRKQDGAGARGSRSSWWRHSPWDGVLVALGVLQGVWLISMPSMLGIAVGLWWTANTVAHNFIHLPFFRSKALNRGFSAWLSLVLGIPQRLWRDRHLAHHAERRWKINWSRQLLAETSMVACLWAALAWIVPAFFWKTYLPGWILGLALCQLQGFYEHIRGATSHYGKVYNLLFFNDGYHAEHHLRPTVHWRTLPRQRNTAASCSRWPPCLRWLEIVSLESLERLVLRSSRLQGLVLHAHARAFRRLLPWIKETREITIVGGGMFPRTALILQQLLPRAQLTILDCNPAHLETARAFLDDSVSLVQARYPCDRHPTRGLLVIPLAYQGNREALYIAAQQPGANPVLVHDWCWRRRGRGVFVSIWLLKRLNFLSP